MKGCTGVSKHKDRLAEKQTVTEKMLKVQEQPKRYDQVRCPLCGHHGCPALDGSRLNNEGRVRYRSCTRCGTTHKTLQKHGKLEEVFLT